MLQPGVDDYYDSDYYKKIPKARYVRFYRRLADKIYAHQKVIDLGCGTGDFLKECKRRESVKSVVGVDNSEKAIITAMQRCNGSVFYKNDIVWFDVGSKKFNTITCFGVLEHIEFKYIVLKNIFNMCEDNARVIIMVPISDFLFRKFWFKGTRQRKNREDVYPIEEWERIFKCQRFDIVNKFIDRHNLTIDWITEKGLLLSPIRLIMAILINILPLKYTYQVFFEMRKKI
jgi:2-polyprenyl-3-methyl-5-hydroxy-6-metoxy-1,4-benzoquinol methylase